MSSYDQIILDTPSQTCHPDEGRVSSAAQSYDKFYLQIVFRKKKRGNPSQTCHPDEGIRELLRTAQQSHLRIYIILSKAKVN